jgi:hypothetical protein
MTETPPTTGTPPGRGKRRWRRIVRWAAAILVLAYMGLVLLLYLAQGQILYGPRRDVHATPMAHEDVTFFAADGVQLAAWYVPAIENRGTVLYCHGNGGNIGTYDVSLLRSLGLNVLIFDYRGYGQSQGEPSEEGTYQDAEAAWRWLVEDRHVPPETIIVLGRSLGGAVAARTAARHTPRALILESAFTSLPDLGQHLLPLMPVRWIARFQYNTLEAVAKVRCPVLVIQSRGDEVVPFSHAERLYEAATGPKTLLEIHGSHDRGSAESADIYLAGIKKFLGL